MALANVWWRKARAFGLVNNDRDLLNAVLTEVNSLDEDLFDHIFGQEWMDGLNVVIARDLYWAVRRVIGNGRKKYF